MVAKFRNTICNSNGTRSVYGRKNPKAVFIVRCLWEGLPPLAHWVLLIILKEEEKDHFEDLSIF
jgi:hypothetical protein